MMLEDRHGGDWYRIVLSIFGFPWLFSPGCCYPQSLVYWMSACVMGFALVWQLVFTVPLGKELNLYMKLIILVNHNLEEE